MQYGKVIRSGKFSEISKICEKLGVAPSETKSEGHFFVKVELFELGV